MLNLEKNQRTFKVLNIFLTNIEKNPILLQNANGILIAVKAEEDNLINLKIILSCFSLFPELQINYKKKGF